MIKPKWHGKPVKVEFGFCHVRTNKDAPGYWFNYECQETGSAQIEAIKVSTDDGQEFCISNHHGVGVYKLQRGGWPDAAHYSLPVMFFVRNHTMEPTPFDMFEWIDHEKRRDKWLMENHFSVWQGKQKLLDAIKKNKYDSIKKDQDQSG